MAWTNMARGAGSVFKASLDSIYNYETAQIMKIVNAYPHFFRGNELFAESNRKKLVGLLSQNIAPGQEV